ILGYARIARLFTIPSILNSSNSEFYAIASRDEDKLKECQEKYGCKKTYLSYDELLCDPKVDAVYIPLPNSLHKEWVIKSVEKGKHVLCEKPISINAKEAVEMKEASIKNNVKLMEGYMYRYTDRKNTIKMKAELGGGSIYDVGCYPLNFVGMIMDEKPISISAEYVDQDSVDIMFTGTLRYKDGVIAVINSGFNAYDRNHSEIIG